MVRPAKAPDQGQRQGLATLRKGAIYGVQVRADLSIVDSILAQIDAGISAGTLSDDELSKLESALKELESRAARYAPHTGE